MALINCSECHREISTKAQACPNCGCPVDANDETQGDNKDAAWPIGQAENRGPGAQFSFRGSGGHGGGRCTRCGSSASRSCTYCGRTTCGRHLTWFHPIKGAGAVCTGCARFGWTLAAVGLVVFGVIVLLMSGNRMMR